MPIKAPAGAVGPGRAVAVQCTVCHGPDGKDDPAELIPSLAGPAPGYLTDQMNPCSSRTSASPATLNAMKALTHSIPDDHDGDLAAYCSSLR